MGSNSEGVVTVRIPASLRQWIGSRANPGEPLEQALVRILFGAREREGAGIEPLEIQISWEERINRALARLAQLVASGVTQHHVAQRLGLHDGTVSFWLAGKWRPKGARLLALEALLDSSSGSELLDPVEEPEKPTPEIPGLDEAITAVAGELISSSGGR